MTSNHEQKPFDIERLFGLVSEIESSTQKYETARLELEFAARGIALILKHYTPLSDDVRIDLQDLADDILRRLNRESNLRSN